MTHDVEVHLHDSDPPHHGSDNRKSRGYGKQSLFAMDGRTPFAGDNAMGRSQRQANRQSLNGGVWRFLYPQFHCRHSKADGVKRGAQVRGT